MPIAKEVKASDAEVEKDPPWPWAGQFIEIALRAIRRVHYEYSPWSLGHQWKTGAEHRPEDINIGRGIELADEVSVCSAISAEFLASKLVAGAQIKGEYKFWEIDREKPYKSKKKRTKGTSRVDLCVTKYFLNKDGIVIPQEPSEPAFIEAKRARIWKGKITDGSAEASSPQYKAVAKDAKKLMAEKMFLKDHLKIHLLIWGIVDSNDKAHSDYPEEVFKEVNSLIEKETIEVIPHEMRWLPLVWHPYAEIKGKKRGTMDHPEVQRWLWITLATVRHFATESAGKK